ncbi:SiaB family protein kinase [Desulfovibrio sp. JC010]|uniref:SiaB family protein kinase n=1 Tax=Desulfovibrio sp. JC010 TaxID=2593641 RepID=UPI0013D72DD4|nr:SiaB family protein kinase [Desulfovibrio sp. JC010]NDV28562.1 hypothetical protein [Desulfovibrio sp. JC010]
MSMELYSYYQEMQKQGTILYFNGPVSQTVVEGIAELLRDKLRADETGMGSVQRVFAVLVEQMQNIVRYSAERIEGNKGFDGEIAFGTLMVGHEEEDGSYYIACGNRVKTAESTEIARRIDILQGMNKDELKAYYKECRKKKKADSVKGAGLGFIDMARKSSRPLDYSITPIDGENSFFMMKVVTV